jgi:hypothetical protein
VIVVKVIALTVIALTVIALTVIALTVITLTLITFSGIIVLLCRRCQGAVPFDGAELILAPADAGLAVEQLVVVAILRQALAPARTPVLLDLDR